MTTAIIGTGGIGSAIACRLASGGETLRLSSADRESARKLAAEIGDAALVAGDNRDALQGADAVLALRFTVLESVIDEMADSLTDKVVVVPSNDGPDALVHASREGREIGTAPGLTATSALGPRQGRASLQMMLAAADLGDRSGSRSGPWTSRGQDGPIHHRRRPPLRSAVALIQKPNRHPRPQWKLQAFAAASKAGEFTLMDFGIPMKIPLPYSAALYSPLPTAGGVAVTIGSGKPVTP
jgi:NAD(P)-dependent dehydrogenase (short-subunit alcohol dehydrogenase family)